MDAPLFGSLRGATEYFSDNFELLLYCGTPVCFFCRNYVGFVSQHNFEIKLALYKIKSYISANIINYDKIDEGFHGRRCLEFCCLGLMAVVYGWILFCSMLRRNFYAASSGVVPLVVRWTIWSLKQFFLITT